MLGSTVVEAGNRQDGEYGTLVHLFAHGFDGRTRALAIRRGQKAGDIMTLIEDVQKFL